MTDEQTERRDLSINVELPGRHKQRFKTAIRVRRILVLAALLLFAGKAVAPERKSVLIEDIPPIKPFTALIYAVGMVESKGDTLAYNESEEAVGFFQIRQVRVDDYNRRTNSNYKLSDMFNYEHAERIFHYYAGLVNPDKLEKIARDWNGSGPMTKEYWKKVKMYLDRRSL